MTATKALSAPTALGQSLLEVTDPSTERISRSGAKRYCISPQVWTRLRNLITRNAFQRRLPLSIGERAIRVTILARKVVTSLNVQDFNTNGRLDDNGRQDNHEN